jgi:hypothetical protein
MSHYSKPLCTNDVTFHINNALSKSTLDRLNTLWIEYGYKDNAMESLRLVTT